MPDGFQELPESELEVPLFEVAPLFEVELSSLEPELSALAPLDREPLVEVPVVLLAAWWVPTPAAIATTPATPASATELVIV